MLRDKPNPISVGPCHLWSVSGGGASKAQRLGTPASMDELANCVISFCFRLYLMLHACAVRFDVMENLNKKKNEFLGEQENGLFCLTKKTPWRDRKERERERSEEV